MQELFRQIYDTHYAKLCAYARKFVFDAAEAEEIVQKAIFKLWEKREILETLDNVEAYLCRAIRNSCFNYLKHAKRVKEHQDKAYIELKQEELSFADPLLITELQQRVAAVTDSLPPACREIYTLSREKGLKNREIADLKGISIKGVEATITRALKLFRDALGDYLLLAIALNFFSL